jgi:hypothetical protein
MASRVACAQGQGRFASGRVPYAPLTGGSCHRQPFKTARYFSFDDFVKERDNDNDTTTELEEEAAPKSRMERMGRFSIDDFIAEDPDVGDTAVSH